MIVRLGLNVALHLAAGAAFGACAVLAGAYLVEKRRRERDAAPVAGAAEPVPWRCRRRARLPIRRGRARAR